MPAEEADKPISWNSANFPGGAEVRHAGRSAGLNSPRLISMGSPESAADESLKLLPQVIVKRAELVNSLTADWPRRAL